jgi:hypothetical protein
LTKGPSLTKGHGLTKGNGAEKGRLGHTPRSCSRVRLSTPRALALKQLSCFVDFSPAALPAFPPPPGAAPSAL